MRAFGIPFKKANISLFGRVLTIYPKATGDVKSSINWLESFKTLTLVRTEIKPLYPEPPKAIHQMASKLGPVFFRSLIMPHHVPRHERWHKDGFKREDPHYHIEFPKPVDEASITKIAALLTEHNALTTEESELLIKTYKEANEIPKELIEEEGLSLAPGIKDYLIPGKKRTSPFAPPSAERRSDPLPPTRAIIVHPGEKTEEASHKEDPPTTLLSPLLHA